MLEKKKKNCTSLTENNQLVSCDLLEGSHSKLHVHRQSQTNKQSEGLIKRRK